LRIPLDYILNIHVTIHASTEWCRKFIKYVTIPCRITYAAMIILFLNHDIDNILCIYNGYENFILDKSKNEIHNGHIIDIKTNRKIKDF
jgi:hypothetical protein